MRTLRHVIGDPQQDRRYKQRVPAKLNSVIGKSVWGESLGTRGTGGLGPNTRKFHAPDASLLSPATKIATGIDGRVVGIAEVVRLALGYFSDFRYAMIAAASSSDIR
jgi:hypothetical protein